MTTGNTTRDEPERPPVLRLSAAVPDHVQDVGSVLATVDVRSAARFASIPGPNLNANYTLTAAIAGRTVIASTAGD